MLRSDTAGYQRELLRYCAEGGDERFGVIEFAVGVDVTTEFRRAVSEVAEQDWQTLYRKVGEHRVDTGQQWADVNFVPNWIGHSKNSPEYRFIAASLDSSSASHWSSRPTESDELIWWRAGQLKSDLAGGRLPRSVRPSTYGALKRKLIPYRAVLRLCELL